MIAASLNARPLADYDICVVGSGPAGLVFALEAARLGQRVLVLESGSDGADQRQQALSSAEILDPARHDDMSIAVARRLGGTSNLWAGRCQPFDPIDFEPRPEITDTGWPIDWKDVEPYYPRALEYMAAGQAVFDMPVDGLSIGDDAFDHTKLERFSSIPAIQKHYESELKNSASIDIRLLSTVVDLALENGSISNLTVADAEGTHHTVPVKTVVLACGGLETTRQLLVLQRKHPGLFGGPDGPLGRYYMGHVIGEVADVTFASAAADAAYDFFRDGFGSYARRRFVPSARLQRENALLNICFWPVVPPVAEPRHRSGILSMICLAFAFAPLGRFLAAEAIRKRHIPDGLNWWPHIRNVLWDIPRTAFHVPKLLYQRYLAAMPLPGFFIRNAGRRYGLSYHSEQSPQPDSRVTLSDETDRFGMPLLRIDYRFARSDAEAVFRTHQLLAGWMERTGLGRIEYRQPVEDTVDAILSLAAHGTHQIGTARMASRAEDGVVDSDLRCFGVDNLYVASSAVFPTSGHCNPTLSIAAFAIRLAEHVAGRSRPLNEV